MDIRNRERSLRAVAFLVLLILAGYQIVATAMFIDRWCYGGPVVGLFRPARFAQGTFQLERGEVFVGSTDGVSEAMNAAGRAAAR